jgi:hypothetical protein
MLCRVGDIPIILSETTLLPRSIAAAGAHACALEPNVDKLYMDLIPGQGEGVRRNCCLILLMRTDG